ncbi:hypothetical protein [Scytonema sp. PRP1]|uniref:hypothetical protein n=1 Tax=Scytonema sp. PRP1 TaxID=3120513 RepID=UPI002FD1EF73
MTHPIYSGDHLTTLKRPELWAICDQLGLPKHSANAKCVDEILAKQSLQIQAVAQSELNVTIEQQAQEVAPEAEIDAVPDSDFGSLYRVWQGMRLIGTFYQSISGEWVARSCGSTECWYCSTGEEAQSRIIETATNSTVDDLLDKPFDELTADEWERLKEYEPQEPSDEYEPFSSMGCF